MRSAAASVVEVADVPPSIIFNSEVVTVAPSRIPISVEVKAAKAAEPPDWKEDKFVRSVADAWAPQLALAVGPVSNMKVDQLPTIHLTS